MDEAKSKIETIRGEPVLTTMQVCEMLNIGRNTLARMVNDNDSGFPKPFSISPRRRRWKKKDVESWIDSKLEQPEC